MAKMTPPSARSVGTPVKAETSTMPKVSSANVWAISGEQVIAADERLEQ